MFAIPKLGEAKGVMENDGLLMEEVGGDTELQMAKSETNGDNLEFEAAGEDQKRAYDVSFGDRRS